MSVIEGRTRTVACVALAGGLVVTGTLATGLLPSGLPYQLLAGGIIVAGFAMLYACLGAFDFEVE